MFNVNLYFPGWYPFLANLSETVNCLSFLACFSLNNSTETIVKVRKIFSEVFPDSPVQNRWTGKKEERNKKEGKNYSSVW